MFVVANTTQINMDNVEEFEIISLNNEGLHDLVVYFVSGRTRVLYRGALEYCQKQLALIMTSHALKQKNT